MSLDSQRWLQLSPWLDQVLDLPPEQRDAWLDALAGRDAALAAELRALLAGGAASGAAQILQGAAPAVALQALAGRRIGAYTLIEPLGEGGMGTVWLAERSDGRFEGRAAVKLLHAGIVQRALAARFRREGAILARLSHPHIARLVDAGLTEDGQPYLVLEHVAGERIDDWCNTRQLSVRARVDLFGQVLQAVQHAHVQLVVHRDLKPSNVLVDGAGKVKLLDFGIAKLLDDEDALGEATELTREGGRVLTPQYAAPEQTRGDTVTTATDVYALGLLLYLLLTGQHPRVDAQGKHAPNAGELPLASRVATDHSRRSGGELQAAAAARGSTPPRLANELAGDLDNILAKALRDEPGERYATAAAFADDLRRHLDGHTVSARPDSWAYRTSRFVGRHKLGVALATVALGAIITAAGVAEQQRREAERERDVATRQRVSAEAVVVFMGEQLGQTDEPGSAVDPALRIDLAQRRASQLFFDEPDALIRLNSAFYALNSMLSRHEAKQRNIEAINAAAAQIDDPIARAAGACLGTAEGMTATAALAQIDRAIAGLPAGEPGRNVRSICLYERSSQLIEAGRYDEAARDFDAAYHLAPVLLRRMNALNHLRSKGELLHMKGQVHEADQLRAQVIEQMHQDGRGHSIRIVKDLQMRVVYHRLMGRPREGLRFAEQAAELVKASGNGASFMPWVTLGTAVLLFDLDRPDDARRLLESVLLRGGQLVPRFVRGLDVVALAHRLRGDHAAAVAVLEQDLAANRAAGYSFWDNLSRASLADELLAMGDPERALATLDVLERDAAAQPFRWEAIWLRTRAHHAAGQFTQAEAAARAAVAEAARRAPPDGRSSLHGHAYLELARALAAQGRAEEARAAAVRAAAELDDALGAEHSATRAAKALVQR